MKIAKIIVFKSTILKLMDNLIKICPVRNALFCNPLLAIFILNIKKLLDFFKRPMHGLF